MNATPYRKRSTSANEKVTIGIIGTGIMGPSNMKNLMNLDDVEVVALCDVDASQLTPNVKAVNARYGKTPETYGDHRKLLERKDIDAVVIATPDHWHAIQFIHAAQAGKEIYIEKPLSHHIVETQAMVKAHRRYKRVVQVGTWQRSTAEFVQAVELIRSGKHGPVVHVRTWTTDNRNLGRKPATTPPSGLDYETWLGPAQPQPYRENTTHWGWRLIKNTGGARTTDWGVHMIDIALLALSKDQELIMPTHIAAVGGHWSALDDDRDAPDTIQAVMKFGDSPLTMSWAVLRDHPGKPEHGIEWVFANGNTLRAWRGGIKLMDGDGKDLGLAKEHYADPGHWENFVDCIKSKELPRSSLESMARTTDVCHLSNAAVYSGEQIAWNAAKMDIDGKAGKDTWAYRRPYRKGYKLP